MLKTVLLCAVLLSISVVLAGSSALEDLCVERNAAIAAGDRTLARELECDIQAELIARQSLPAVDHPVAVSVPGRGAVVDFDPDVLITDRQIRAFDTDYQMDGEMWVAFTTTDDTAYIYNSSDHGATWNHFVTTHWIPATPITDVGIVVGEGDSAFVHLFLYNEDHRGSCYLLRFNLAGQYINQCWPFVREDAMDEFAFCRDYTGDDYWLYGLVTGPHPDDWGFFLRSTDYGNTWAITDSIYGRSHPHVSAGAGAHIYYAATLLDTSDSYVNVALSRWYGSPGNWISMTLYLGTVDVGDVAIASDFTLPESTAAVWFAWAEDTLQNNDWDIHYGWTNDAGLVWNIEGVLAGGPGQQRFPDLHNYTDPGNPWMNLSYISEEGFRAVHRRHCNGADPAGWSAPTVINVTNAGTGSQVVPRLTYSPGSPGTGAGCVFAGAGLTGLYWNAPWHVGVAEPPRAERPSVSSLAVVPSPAAVAATFRWQGNARSLRLYDRAGALVREFESPTGLSLRWDLRGTDGRRLASGVYLGVLETEAGPQLARLVLAD